MKNLYTLMGRTTHKTNETLRPYVSGFGKAMLLFCLLTFFTSKVDAQCTHSIQLTDTYGDGWNGGRVSVSVNGTTVLTNLGSTFTTGLTGPTFTFTASAGQTIRVWKTANGTYPTEMRVRVFNNAGVNITGLNVVNPGTGTATSGGLTGTAVCAASGPTLNVPFTGNNSNPCGTNITLYDHAGTGAYGNNANGYTVLNNAGSATITISGTSSGEACCDYVRVYRGVGTAGTLVGTYYMNTAIPTITSLIGQALTVQFISDGSVTGNGFQINVSYAGSCAVTACSGTPAPGNSITSSATVGSGSTVNLSLQNATNGSGVTYQWQSGPSSSGPWTNFGTSASTQTSPAITANIWFRCIVTCSGISGTSTPVQVSPSYCVPTGTAAYFITGVSTTGGVANFSNLTASNGGYGNFTGTSASNSIGTATTVTVTHSATGGGAGVGIWIDWNNDLDFADANEQIGVSGAWNFSPYNATVNIPAGTPLGSYRMRVVIDYNATSPIACPVGISGETEDYTFSVVTPPSCSAPTGLTSSTVTSTTATISWTAPASAPASGYNYYVSTSATAPTAGTTPTGSTAAGVTSVNLTGLSANTTYYFWVRGNCGGASGTSAWVGASNFYTGPCVPTGTASYIITNVTTSGGTTNIANATGSNAGYGNFMAQSASNSIGTGTTFSIAHTATGGGAGVGVWINWNNDMDFADANEQIAITTGWNFSPFTGTITIPAGTPAGNYQMRVVMDYNSIAPSSCPVGISGESEDYTFTVITLPPCAGTPNPGATTASTTQVFAGGSTTLGITTAQSGTGITYQWQSSASASGPWASIGGATAATYVATPSAATYYQCIVTCSSGPASATSTSILISFNAYCNPDYTGYTGTTPQNGTEGTVDGDMITNVTITGTSLNNTSTAALSSPQYTFYSSLPAINMLPSNSYNVNVTAGAFTLQNFAVWIDYNDDNDFYDAGELIGYSSAATSTAYQTVSFTINLACTPPYGTHRMRVRDAFNVAGSTMDPCATYGWGETEDYLITIVAGTPFAPAFTATPTTPNCVGAQVTYTATAGQTNYAWTFPGTAGVDYTLVSGGTSASNTAVVTYNTSGSNTITMNYASPLGCASSGAINNTITVGAGTFATSAVNGDVVWRGATSVDWATPSNWYYYNGSTYTVAGVSPNNTTRTIIPTNACVTQQPSVAGGTTVNAKDVVIETGATLTMTTGTLNVSGNFVNNGTFVAGTGKVAFNTASTISGNATTFNDVDVNNGVNFGSSLSTVNGTMTINNGGWVNTNPPTYGLNSLLRYNTGGSPYGRGFEWSTTSGAGYPNDVQISNNTTINYPNTGGAFSTNLGVRRDLTIDAGSNVYMDYGTGNASGSLTVGRNVTSAGDLSLGNQIGGDIYVGGNWTRTTGNLYANNRAVFFNGATGNQTITKAGGETFPYMVVNKASGNVILANNVTVSGGLTLTSGLVEVGTNNVVMGASSLSGGSATSYVKTASTGILSRNVAGTATTFPIGNGSFNPATLTNTGTADVFSLRVIDNVTSNGTGVGATTTEAVVNRTWMIDEATIGGSNVTLRLQWNGAGEQINTFSPSSAFIAHYMSSAAMWDNIGGTVGADFVESAGITSFSPFTISSSPTFAPLPVELLSLNAQCAGENVIVSWKTASEHNSLNFVVERSENGTSWSEIQTVGAAGNSNTIIEYAIEDAGAARGVKYYRLIQTDQDGVQKVYGPVMSNCGSDENMFMSFPNPSDADITLIVTDKKINGSTTLTVRDAHGRVVRSMALEIQPGTTSILIPDMELEPAVYYLQLVGDNFTSPVIKHSLR